VIFFSLFIKRLMLIKALRLALNQHKYIYTDRVYATSHYNCMAMLSYRKKPPYCTAVVDLKSTEVWGKM